MARNCFIMYFLILNKKSFQELPKVNSACYRSQQRQTSLGSHGVIYSWASLKLSTVNLCSSEPGWSLTHRGEPVLSDIFWHTTLGLFPVSLKNTLNSIFFYWLNINLLLRTPPPPWCGMIHRQGRSTKKASTKMHRHFLIQDRNCNWGFPEGKECDLFRIVFLSWTQSLIRDSWIGSYFSLWHLLSLESSHNFCMLFFLCVMSTFCKWRKERNSFLTQFSDSYEITSVI